jgi:DivIVA domain-containing protein
MAQFLILVVVALVAAALAWGVAVLLTGRDAGLDPAEPDGRATPLPAARPLTEPDLGQLRFDIAPRGYRMSQVDQALRRAAYDIGYKEELINVLEAEVAALREGRTEEAESLRQAREAAQAPRPAADPDAVSIDLGVVNGAAHAPAPAASDVPLRVASEGPVQAEPDDSVDGDTVPTETDETAGQPDQVRGEWVATGARANGAAAGQPATATSTGTEPADADT